MQGEEVTTKEQVEIYALDFDGYSRLEDYCKNLKSRHGRNADERAKWLVDVYNCALYNDPKKVALWKPTTYGQNRSFFTQEDLLSKFIFLNDIKESMKADKQIKIMIGSNRQGLQNEKLNTFGSGERPRDFCLSCRTCLSLLQKVIDSKGSFIKSNLDESDYMDEIVQKVKNTSGPETYVSENKQAIEWKYSGPPEIDGKMVTEWKDLADDVGNIRIERLTHEMLAKYNGDLKSHLDVLDLIMEKYYRISFKCTQQLQSTKIMVILFY